MKLTLNDLDRRIWESELEKFVPMTVFDTHTHVYDWRMDSPDVKNDAPPDPGHGRFPLTDRSTLQAIDAVLMPGRTVHRISFPCPLQPAPPAQTNAFAARQADGDPQSAILMHVRPDMTPGTIDAEIKQHGFRGFKPYRMHSVTGDVAACRITDYLPEPQIEMADAHGLMVMLHLSRREAIGDKHNLDDLERLQARFPRVQWILAHCARSYYDGPLLAAADRLKEMPNLWYEISSVCDSDAMSVLLEIAGPDRVMYGSDDMPVGSTRGKYISFGSSWTELNERNHGFKLDHCDGRMTFVRYESLRAFRRACRRQGYGTREIEKLFAGNAQTLLAQTGHPVPA